MRLARRLTVVVVVLVAVLVVADVLIKDGVQTAIANRIEARDPGSHARVSISSFPFVGHLVVGGDVPSMQADVTDLRAGPLVFDRVVLRVSDLTIDRNALLHGRVRPLSIRRGSVTAEITQASIDRTVHLPVRLGDGTVALAGVSVRATLSVQGDQVHVDVAGVTSFTLTVPALDVLPCIGAAAIVTGALALSCTFHTLPKVLVGASFGA